MNRKKKKNAGEEPRNRNEEGGEGRKRDQEEVSADREEVTSGVLETNWERVELREGLFSGS
ncbi:hypothetical protein Sjap_023125 [Stephania japonica]|uniref:Uncharacterized protein n=1 Tax=Stephania japonica TaxID=461633 RepID=A0AAP0EXA9_9MAGN